MNWLLAVIAYTLAYDHIEKHQGPKAAKSFDNYIEIIALFFLIPLCILGIVIFADLFRDKPNDAPLTAAQQQYSDELIRAFHLEMRKQSQ